MMAGIARLHRFPKCPHTRKLGGYVGNWLTLKRQYGADLPGEYLWVMLSDILPGDVASEIKDRPHLDTVPKVTDYISGELARYNDKHLGKVHGDEASTNARFRA